MTSRLDRPGDSSDGAEVLQELALNLRSAWNHRADALWEQIDPEMWRETGNPVARRANGVCQRGCASSGPRRPSARRPTSLHAARQSALSGPAWFSGEHAGNGAAARVAFFSLEYALSEALPIYSGGLGNVAGDYLKAASDLGVPVVGVGLLYQQGYFRQTIDADGAQREFYPFNDVSLLPRRSGASADGGRVRVRLPRAGPTVWLRAWEARVGRVPLYLLDSNDPANTPADRGITASSTAEAPRCGCCRRWRSASAAGACSARSASRRTSATSTRGTRRWRRSSARGEFMHDDGLPFDVALAATRAGNVFTTHTPVEAGFDRFAPRARRGVPRRVRPRRARHHRSDAPPRPRASTPRGRPTSRSTWRGSRRA